MTRRFALLLACAAVVAAATAGAQARQYRARLAPVPLDVAMQATIAGAGSVTGTLAGSTLTLSGTYKDLRTAATVVRLHRGPRIAMRGPAIAELKASGGTAGTISGTIELTKEQLEDLSNARLYIQLHSEKAPEGNLWGWLFAQEGKK